MATKHKTFKRNIGGRRISAAMTVIVVIAAFFICNHFGVSFPSWLNAPRDASVHFIDVGQGDAALILTEKSAVVIDAGPASSADKLTEYISAYTSKIDCLVISHPHEDHMGGAAKLLERLPVDKIIMNSDASDSGFFSKTLDVIAEKGIDLYKAGPGDTYGIEDITLELFAPLKDYGDKNNNSVVLKASIPEFSVIFTGDAEAEAEKDILEIYGSSLDADVLKVGHHGSSTSTSEVFLSFVSPEIAVISCAAGNSYGHPHSETLSKLAMVGANVYRTDKDGTAVVYYDVGALKVR